MKPKSVHIKTDKDLVQQFHREIVELIKKYQFRDRNEMVGHGLTVSQCYILETLNQHGALEMQQLADKMHLSISTVTRAVEPLVVQKLVDRIVDPNDNRVRVIAMTERGQTLFEKHWEGVLKAEKTILESFPEESREMLIDFLRKLNAAFGNWQLQKKTKDN
ncbi:MarR family transcriptional regulator [bacterium]|nr:MarR family transcriptional regulator [bacterium]